MNLIIIARHYSKQLLRNRLFQVYFLLSFAGIIYIQIHNQSDLPQYSVSGLVSLSSFIPYMNAYLFTLFQVIPVLFLTNALLSRERKIDSMDAIFYRPESNAEYVWGNESGIYPLYSYHGMYFTGICRVDTSFC